ncbi:MAG: FHA domain-containing protein, partial [Moraxellaceae bacterium]
MSLDYFVEILNNNGDVNSRHKFSSLPIRIGRAYTNDVILEDPHTAAEHALIDINDAGIVYIQDLGSDNGLTLNGKRQQEFNVHGDDIFRLGQTRLRMRTSRYVVAKEISDDTKHHWEGWPLLITAITIITLLSLAGTWLADIEAGKTTAYITDACTSLGLAAAWAGIWALANRVFGGGA